MATIETCIEQISSTTAFYDSQQAVGVSAAVATQSMDGMMRSLLTHIASIAAIDIAGAAKLNVAVAASRFSQEQKTTLANAIADKHMKVSLPNQALGGKIQKLMNPLTYFTAHQWKVWMDHGTSMGQKVSLLGDAMRMMGCLYCSQMTIKALTAMMACCIWPKGDPTCQQLHDLAKDIKTAIDSHKGNSAIKDVIAEYPPDPRQLPSAIFNAIYSRVDPPVVKTLERYAEFFNKKFLRSSATNVRSRCETGAALPASSNPSTTTSHTNVVEELLMRLGSRALQEVSPPASPQVHPGVVPETPRLALPWYTTTEQQQQQQHPHQQAHAPTSSVAMFHAAAPSPFTADGSADVGDDDDDEDAVAELERMATGSDKRMSCKTPSKKRKSETSGDDEDDDETEESQKPQKAYKRPGAAANAKPVAAPAKGKPLTAHAKAKALVLKRPGGVNARPPMPPASHSGSAIPYSVGKVLVSHRGKGFRVFKRAKDKVDKMMPWKKYGGKEQAWTASLDYIDEHKND